MKLTPHAGMLLPAMLLVALACATDRPNVVIRAELNHTPLGGLPLEIVPFDASALLDSLAEVAGHLQRAPDFTELERTLLAYHRPDPEVIAGRDTVWLTTQDSASRLADSLRHLDRRAPGYPAAYARFRGLYQRMLARLRARQGGRGALPADDRELADQAAAAADDVRSWESVAYRDYPRLAAERLAEAGREPIYARTDSAGRAVVRLEPGTWWIRARLRDPGNPFAERVWQVRVDVPRWSPVVVPLFTGNSERTWRH